MENLRKKELKGNSGNKNFLKSNKKCREKPLWETTTSGTQNLRT
jgi:hypothetical protein